METNCTLYKTADFIGKRWTLLILLEIHKNEKPIRYSELKKTLPNITPKILSLRLKELEKQKMIKKNLDSTTVPIKSFYALTNSGKDFIKIIKQIKKWSLKWNVNNKLCESSDCKQCTLQF